jgi:glycosyltransferase involved in cell wall biosynthesis
MSISLLVSTYGDENWKRVAERALTSAVGQNWHELFAVHSPDGTVASSRNLAAQQATGDWLLFLDADDELAPGYVGAMERALEREGTDGNRRLLLTPAVSVVRNGRAGPPTFFRAVPLRQANWLVIGTLVHRDLFWEVGGFPEAEHGLEDWALWSKCARVGATVVKVPDAVYRYWANPQSMHRQLWRDKNVQRAAHRRVARELDEWEAARETPVA